MTVSTQQQCVDAYKTCAQAFSAQRLETGAVTKGDVLAAVIALDSFFDTNGGAINTAIPQPARGVLTQQQKAWLVVQVIRMRYGV